MRLINQKERVKLLGYFESYGSRVAEWVKSKYGNAVENLYNYRDGVSVDIESKLMTLSGQTTSRSARQIKSKKIG
ncbi:hypothetical protein ACVWYG_001626 [Pedobacter sp. UYEF25]